MKLRRFSTFIVLVALLAGWFLPLRTTFAANLGTISDTVSTLTQGVVANHDIRFVLPTGVDASTDTISVNFTDFTTTGVAFGDIDLAISASGACSTFPTEKTLAASTAAGTWGVALASDTFTFTAPTDATSGEITAGRCVQIEIGFNAAGGDTQMTNPNDTNTHVVEITSELGAIDDSGSFALDFVADDSVSVTATVDPSITFSISDVAVGFGILDTVQECWANGTPPTNCDSTAEAAHTMAVSTNATDGWAITYNGATLTSGSDTITVADINGDADGTPGTEQFAIGATTNGNATIATDYDQASNNFRFIAATTTTLVSEIVPTATETISAYYLANIAGDTEAGTYSTSITYIATATF